MERIHALLLLLLLLSWTSSFVNGAIVKRDDELACQSGYQPVDDLCIPSSVLGQLQHYPVAMTKYNVSASLQLNRRQNRMNENLVDLMSPGGHVIATVPRRSAQRKISDTKTICYYTNWSSYSLKFKPSDIPTDLCTHVLYAFFVINDNGEVKLSDHWADVGMKSIAQVVGLRNTGIVQKVIFSVGGWTYSGFETGRKWFDLDNEAAHLTTKPFATIWSEIMKSADARKRFIDSVALIRQTFGFDGIEIDLEYPSCPQGECSPPYEHQSQDFISLVREMRTILGNEFSISVASSAAPSVLSRGPNVTDLVQYLDFVSVMTYDYYVYLEGSKSGHNQPKSNVTDSIVFFLGSFHVPPEKLMIGVSMYARGYKVGAEALAQAVRSNVFSGIQSVGASPQFPMSQAPGIATIKELCLLKSCAGGSGGGNGTSNPAVSSEMDCRRSYYTNDEDGSWLSYGDSILAYTDIKDLRVLRKIHADYKLGGFLVYAIDQEDFDDSCRLGLGKFPFLRALLENKLDGDNLLWTAPSGNEPQPPDENTTTTTTTPPPPTSPPSNDACVSPGCSASHLVVSKCDCNKYYSCADAEHPLLNSCPATLVFNEATQSCDYKGNVNIGDIPCNV